MLNPNNFSMPSPNQMADGRNEMTKIAPEYVTARRVLLDALTALDPHRDNLVFIGAQAVYHHTGEGDLNVPIMTTDADLAINAVDLASDPEIGELLRSAGFVSGSNPGRWIGMNGVAIDLMVVPHQSGMTKATARAAKLIHHDNKTARIARGLEPALVDNMIGEIVSFEAFDPRRFELRTAGPAALLVAKAIKISERLNQSEMKPDRLKEKDALDAFRLLQAVDTEVLVQGFNSHASEENSRVVSAEVLHLYKNFSSNPQAVFPTLATKAAGNDPTIGPAFVALVGQLLDSL